MNEKMNSLNYVIGIDFDNTIASYDDIMHKLAVQQGLIQPDVKKSKKHLRDYIRQLPNGEIEWQRIQGIVYGPRMGEAKLIGGVWKFFESCRLYKAKTYIVSHKTEFARFDETGTNLRASALEWMKRNRFFEANGFGLSQEEDVYFESTRREKIERIRHLGCTHFIDDLEETFLDELFPTNVEKILYAPHMQDSFAEGVKVATTWEEISGFLFNTRD